MQILIFIKFGYILFNFLRNYTSSHHTWNSLCNDELTATQMRKNASLRLIATVIVRQCQHGTSISW